MEKVDIFVDAGNFYHMVLRKLGCHEVDLIMKNLPSSSKAKIAKLSIAAKDFTLHGKERMNGHESKHAMQTRPGFLAS